MFADRYRETAVQRSFCNKRLTFFIVPLPISTMQIEHRR